MPVKIICCMPLPPATISSVPISNYAEANEELAGMGTKEYYSCCGKAICGGCIYSFHESGNNAKCPFCNSDRADKTDEDKVEELMKRVEANDAGAIYVLGSYYAQGQLGLLQDQAKAMELWKQAAGLGSSEVHYELGIEFYAGGDLKKAKFHWEAAAMAGHEVARFNLGTMEAQSGNMERAVKHWAIASSAGHHNAMINLLVALKRDLVPQDEIESALTAYNNSCVEMRSEARDAFIASIAAR
jgi:TPR repeat protein